SPDFSAWGRSARASVKTPQSITPVSVRYSQIPRAVLRCGGTASVRDDATSPFHAQAALRQELERQRINAVLLREHAGGKRFLAVLLVDRHFCLNDDRA